MNISQPLLYQHLNPPIQGPPLAGAVVGNRIGGGPTFGTDTILRNAVPDQHVRDGRGADFSVALSSGFNLKMSALTTFSSEIRGKWSEDSSTISGKLGLKIAF